jgi:hypothetical protein
MLKLQQIWGTYKLLILMEGLAIILLISGVLTFYAGWMIGTVSTEETPLLSHAFEVFCTLGITLIFFGFTLFWEFGKGYIDEQNNKQIQESLKRLETHFGCYPEISVENHRYQNGRQIQPFIFTDKAIYFTVGFILLILSGFLYYTKFYSFSAVILILIVLWGITHFYCCKNMSRN